MGLTIVVNVNWYDRLRSSSSRRKVLYVYDVEQEPLRVRAQYTIGYEEKKEQSKYKRPINAFVLAFYIGRLYEYL